MGRWYAKLPGPEPHTVDRIPDSIFAEDSKQDDEDEREEPPRAEITE
jgi:hypothetical protein